MLMQKYGLMTKIRRMICADSNIESGSDCLIYSIESPKFHRLRFDGKNVFSGCLVWMGRRRIRSLHVRRDRKSVGEFPVNVPRPDIASLAPHVPDAATCGFEFEIEIKSTTGHIDFTVEFDDGSLEYFLRYDVHMAWKQRHELMQIGRKIDSLPAPNSELVFMTQGIYDVQAYTDSVVPGVMYLKKYMKHAGVDFKHIHRILDFGCGSGRLLSGFWGGNPSLELYGCDINSDLISWAGNNLPGKIHFKQNDFYPPNPFSDIKFDLIYLISVFTHLSIESQKRWVNEFFKILRPGGTLVISLQGETYARYFSSLDENELQAFMGQGYYERRTPKEGANEFGAFHTRSHVCRIFEGFRLCSFFPNGRISGKRIPFPPAAMQDVYVFQRLY